MFINKTRLEFIMFLKTFANWFSGPYQIQDSLRVESYFLNSDGTSKTLLNNSSATEEHAGVLIEVLTTDKKLKIRLNPNTALTIQKANLTGYETIYKSQVLKTEKAVEFLTDAEGGLRLAFEDGSLWVLVSDSKLIESFKLPSWFTPKGFARLFTDLSLAGTLHILFVATFLGINLVLPTISKFLDKKDLAKEEAKQQKQEELIPVEMLEMAKNYVPYAGQDFVIQQNESTQNNAPEISKKTLTGISKIAAALNSFKLSGISKAVSQAKGLSTEEIQNKLAKMNSSNFISGLQSLELSGKKAGNSRSRAQDAEALAKVFRGLQGEFRGCYEKALLVDANLALTIQMEADVIATGKLGEVSLDLNGLSTPSGRERLVGCVKAVLNKVQVDKGLSGVRFKNQIIFRS